MRKLFKFFAIAMTFGLFLAGCNEEKKEETKGVSAPAPREKVRVALWGGELQAHFTTYLCEKFPDVDFEFSLATNSTDYYRYLAEHDDLPDIFTVRRFSLSDVVELKEKLYDLSNTKAASFFYGSYLESYAYADGVVNWLPACAVVDSVIANQSLFEKYGIPLPTDYASFTAACREFEKHGIRGFTSDFGSDYSCMEILQGAAIASLSSPEGVEWRKRYESGKTRELSREVWMPAFEKMFDLREKASLGREDTLLRNEDVKVPFMEGRLAMYRGTGRDLITFPAPDGGKAVLLPYFADEGMESRYLTYPAFQLAVSKKGMEDKKREALILDIVSAMLDEQGMKEVSDGKSMVAYSRNVSLGMDPQLDNLKSALAENRMYIRIASSEMFSLSSEVVQKILRGELSTPVDAFNAFNELMKGKQREEDKVVAHIGESVPYAFDRTHGSRAASALFNTVRAEAGVDLVLAQACYAGNVYAGDYTARDVRYLTKNDDSWPILATVTGEQLFSVLKEMLVYHGTSGTVSNESTLYVSSGFEMHMEKQGGKFLLKELTVHGKPMDRKAAFRVYILSDVDFLVPTLLKAVECRDFERIRTRSNDYLYKRLVEKGGDLEKPTDYISIR